MADKKTGIDQELILNLANILKDTDLTEIEVEQDNMRIRVSRNSQTVYAPPQQYAYAPQMMQAPQAAPAAVVASPMAAAVASNGFTLTSPMVGTGQPAFRRDRHSRQGRPDRSDHRSDEDHEPDSGAPVGEGNGDHGG